MENKKTSKWVWIVGIIAVLAFIGYLQEEKENESATTPQQVERVAEQPQETEAERQAREQEEAEAEQAEQVEVVADTIDVAEETETTTEEANPQESKKNSFLGTYEITDKVGCTIRITLNEDETATITGVRGEDVTYYCSWSDENLLGVGIGIRFSDDKPYLVYEGGADVDKYTKLYIKEGWIYSGDSNAESKNPKWRLKLKKIK